MLGDANWYLDKRARELGLGRAEDLGKVQKLLDRLYAGQTRALKIKDGALTIITPSASVASDLRLRQTELIDRFGKEVTSRINRLVIMIRSLG